MEPGAIVFLIVLTLSLLIIVPLGVGYICYDPAKLATADKAKAEQEQELVPPGSCGCGRVAGHDQWCAYSKVGTAKAEGME